MSQTDLSKIIQQLEFLSLDEKKVLSNHLASLDKLERSSNFPNRLDVIQENRAEIQQIASDYGASNLRYLLDETEVIFVIDLARGRSLLDLGGLLSSLREILGFEVIVLTETMIKQKFREQILRETINL